MNNIIINLTKEEIIIDVQKNVTLDTFINELKSAISIFELIDFSKKIPITITGIFLTEHEFKSVATIIKGKADTVITYKKPNSLGLHNIKKTYEDVKDNTLTKFVRAALRSGQKIEHDGSLVILGDVNPGSEVIASENIVVVGNLRGIAHARC